MPCFGTALSFHRAAEGYVIVIRSSTEWQTCTVTVSVGAEGQKKAGKIRFSFEAPILTVTCVCAEEIM